jgi:hypothetical protein
MGSLLYDSLSFVEGVAAMVPFFLPLNISLPLSSGSDIVSGATSTLLQGSSLDAFPSPLSPLQDLDVNMGSFHQPIELFLPHSCAPCLSKVETIANVLDTLKKAKITPTNFLLHILDESCFTSYHTPFYNSEKFRELLNLFWKSEHRSLVMKDWLQPNTICLVCELVHSEMEYAKPYLHMSSNKVTLDFLSDWDINQLMDLISQNVMPVWSEILDAATEHQESKVHKKGSGSCNWHVVGNDIHWVGSLG